MSDVQTSARRRRSAPAPKRRFAISPDSLKGPLAIVGGLFVMEAMSVIIQVGYFKMTGRRVFLMAPIHHHFEKLGWTESQVVIRFWIIAVILALVGLSSLKLR